MNEGYNMTMKSSSVSAFKGGSREKWKVRTRDRERVIRDGETLRDDSDEDFYETFDFTPSIPRLQEFETGLWNYSRGLIDFPESYENTRPHPSYDKQITARKHKRR